MLPLRTVIFAIVAAAISARCRLFHWPTGKPAHSLIGRPFRHGLTTLRLVCIIASLSLATTKTYSEEPASVKSDNKPSPQTTDADSREKEAEETKRLTELFLRSQNVFLRKGELMVELGTSYFRNNQQVFVPVVGGVARADSTRRFIDTTVTARYGVLTDGLELDIIAPLWVHGEVSSDFGVVQTRRTEDAFGDLSAALRYQVWYERGNRPSLIVDVTGKSRTGGTGLTGTGVWNAGGGLTLMKSIDPVILFGRVGYIHNFASSQRDLGDIINYQLGFGFSLNDRVSFTMQLAGAVIEPSQLNAVGLIQDVGGSTVAVPITVSTRRLEIMNLIFTTTMLVTKHLFIEPFVGVGLTNESFTMVGIRVPYRF